MTATTKLRDDLHQLIDQGEEKAYQLLESIRQKADVLYQPMIGSL